MWLSLKKVNDFDVPIGAILKSVDGLGMLLTDDEGQVHLITMTILPFLFTEMASVGALVGCNPSWTKKVETFGP